MHVYTSLFNWVKVSGTKYQTPCVLIVEEEDPTIGNVHQILVCGDDECELMETHFIHHYHAYALTFLPSSSRQTSSRQHFVSNKQILYITILMVSITAQIFNSPSQFTGAHFM